MDKGVESMTVGLEVMAGRLGVTREGLRKQVMKDEHFPVMRIGRRYKFEPEKVISYFESKNREHVKSLTGARA